MRPQTRSKSLSPVRDVARTANQPGRGQHKTSKRARSLSPLYPRPKRIGGGYDWEPLPDIQHLLHSPRRPAHCDGSRMLQNSAARAAKAARKRMYSSSPYRPPAAVRRRSWALKAVPGQKDVYTEWELSIIAEMLFLAENGRPTPSGHAQVSSLANSRLFCQ